MKSLIPFLIVVNASMAAPVQRFLPTSQVVQIAGIAARDEGFNPDASNAFLDALRTNGQEPIPGYASIGLYVDDHLVRSYSIRVETGDVVDAMSCTIFRYPDLLSVKQKLQRGFGTKDVSVDQISSEVGCNELKVLNHKTEKPIK